MSQAQHHYEARCERDGRAWSVDVAELRIHTFGRDLADAEAMARDAIAGVLDVPLDSVSVSLEVAGAAGPVREARDARQARRAAAGHESTAVADAIAALKRSGASQRDVARLLGISHQRVSQISSGRKSRSTPTTFVRKKTDSVTPAPGKSAKKAAQGGR